MPKRVQWASRHSVGNPSLDAQHRELLALCNALADCLDAADVPRFDAILQELMALARAHFAAEEALLARAGHPDLDAQRHEREEYDYLAAEIATPDNFDREELQSFLALWWSGHILGAARSQRACPGPQSTEKE